METSRRYRSHLRHVTLVALAAILLGGCPTPIPKCLDTRVYVPEVVVAPPEAKADSLIIGRLLVGGGAAVNPVSVELSRLDEDIVVARTTVRLAPDGRFAWGLERGHYVIARVDRYSDYAKGQYQIQASFYPHLRFEAIGTRYIGQARAVLDSSLDDILPAGLFVPGTPRQGRLGVSAVAVTDELRGNAPCRQRPPRCTAQA